MKAMTHTSTEQPEALRLAAILEKEDPYYGVTEGASYELRRLHARVQELEASQARVPLSDEDILEIASDIDRSDDHESHIDELAFARAIESAHGITQEKQG